MKEYMPFIKGRNIPSKEGKIIDDRNPATGEVFAKVHLASVEDIEEAISTAYAASKLWAKTTPREKEAVWNDPTTLDTLETVNTVDNDHMKHQEEKVIPWQINYTQTSSNKRQSIKL
ncbi:aldehyde dehydrogenase family protein [Sulfurospirillum sp. UCH001]|uniref:aldehyde dehydrogenase family protein n=1 Tax=Sulfurospirillum sp. UCH001 TaxID=1581011 RepID=UPI000836E593|nr:aldehyde dehydrogenase family protein [Sulfurospirillum sp. UCH001]